MKINNVPNRKGRSWGKPLDGPAGGRPGCLPELLLFVALVALAGIGSWIEVM